MAYFQPSTWRLLGLSVGMGYVFFGSLEILRPAKVITELMGIPKHPSPEATAVVSVLSPLMGSRDLAIATTIFALYHMGRDKEMGVTILAGTILGYADAMAVGIYKGLGS